MSWHNHFAAPLCLALSLGFSLVALASSDSARTITVGPGGACDFTSIAAAVASVNDATAAHPVNVLIRPGVYKETVTTRDWVNLIGEDRDRCIMQYTLAPDQAAEMVHHHVIFAATNTTIRNLTLVGGIVKYCIHTDGGAGPFVLTVENCVLRRDFTEPVSKQYPAAFGIGLGANQHIVMKDCVLEAIMPIYWHNWQSQRASCSITLEHCVLKGADYAINILNLGSKQKDYFVIHDCTLRGAKAAVLYENARNIKGASWYGDDETILLGSGNSLSTVESVTMKDDSAGRQSGLDLARETKPQIQAGTRIEEDYGAAAGRVRESKMWSPMSKPGHYCLKTEVAQDALVFTCPPVEENPDMFGYASGLEGPQVAMPMAMEIRLKCSFTADGFAQLYYCQRPQMWLVEWRADRVVDANNPAASIPVDTTAWQTYRLVAKTPEDVRLFVEGVPGDGIALTPGKHPSEYFQFRVFGHGSKVELDHTKLSGIPAVK